MAGRVHPFAAAELGSLVYGAFDSCVSPILRRRRRSCHQDTVIIESFAENIPTRRGLPLYMYQHIRAMTLPSDTLPSCQLPFPATTSVGGKELVWYAGKCAGSRRLPPKSSRVPRYYRARRVVSCTVTPSCHIT